jgi:uracil-DNA glycosylase
MTKTPLATLLKQVRACRICEDSLEDGVRPVVQVGAKARILIAGQAPGRRVHESGVPFDDPSGHRLREWMGVSKETFYDPSKVAILPMGFCYPGTGKSGDLPPRPECAEEWRDRLLERLPSVQLTLVIGQYAARWHLIAGAKRITDLVRDWAQFAPAHMPLPHPSPRNNIWLKKNQWFSTEVLPHLRQRVALALGE